MNNSTSLSSFYQALYIYTQPPPSLGLSQIVAGIQVPMGPPLSETLEGPPPSLLFLQTFPSFPLINHQGSKSVNLSLFFLKIFFDVDHF